MPIVIEKLTYTYQSGSVNAFTALKDIDLTIEDGEFVGWFPEALEGDWTLEDLEEFAMYDEILWPGDHAQIWGEITWYALLRDGDLYFTVGE